MGKIVYVIKSKQFMNACKRVAIFGLGCILSLRVADGFSYVKDKERQEKAV